MDINLIELKITAIQQETADAYSYTLMRLDGEPLVYKAGQFLTLLLQIDGTNVRRSYSFSSSPGEQATITVKRVVNGLASRYIIDHFYVGKTITCLAPSGKFVVEDEVKNLFFVVAGSGITPAFSIIKNVLKQQTDQLVFLVYQNRNEQLSIFRKDLFALQKQFHQRFTIIELFSEPSGDVQPQRLNNYLLEQLVRKYAPEAVHFYTSGPISFVQMTAFTLRTIGFGDHTIKKENFEIPPAPAPSLPIDTSTHMVTIHYKDAVETIYTAYPNSILQAALQQNVRLPYSCRAGRCSTCAVKLLSGKMFMYINEVLTEKDIADGWVLTCVGYAQTDLAIKIETP